jgi:hypothetical protein
VHILSGVQMSLASAHSIGCSERRLIGHSFYGTFCEGAATLAEENAAAGHHVLRRPISLHSEHSV